MKRDWIAASKMARLVLPDWRIAKAKAGRLKFHYIPTREKDIDQMIDAYHDRGGPLGSAWKDNKSIDYVSVQESLVNVDGLVAYAGDPPTPFLPDTEWTWQKVSIPKMTMPNWACRVALPIENVEIVRLDETKKGPWWQGHFQHHAQWHEFVNMMRQPGMGGETLLWEYWFGAPEWLG